MSDLKTQANDGDVRAFLASVENEKRRQDAFKVLALMEEITGEKPTMWGTSIIGFGRYDYKYETGREGKWFKTGFSPRKQNLTLYLMSGFADYGKLMSQLGKHKTGKSCLYINKLEDIDMDVLRALVKQSVAHVSRTHDD